MSRSTDSGALPPLVTPGSRQIAVATRIGLFRRCHGPARSLVFQFGVIVNEAFRARSIVHRAGLRASIRPSRVQVGDQPGFVAFAGVDWWYHNRAHSDVQLLRQVALGRPVLMVNSLGLRVPLPGRSSQPLRRIARKMHSALRYVRTPIPAEPNFHVMTPIALPLYNRRWIRNMSARFTRWQVERVARWYLLARPHVFVTIPSAGEVASGMRRTSLTFNRSDLHSAFPEVNRDLVEAMERGLLVHSDLVVYASHGLMAKDRTMVGDRAYFLDHGADLDHFTRRASWPADIEAIPQPRIGFFGGLDDYVIDFDLLELVAHGIPHASLVLIGDATCSMERFDHLPNVYWLGMRPYQQIPGYASAFDVAIMPWLDNEWITYCNPVKLKEYLALGLPVVSMDFPELSSYGDLVRIAADYDAFIALVKDALSEPSNLAVQQARRARVVNDTWSSKALELLRIVDAIALGSRGPFSAGEV